LSDLGLAAELDSRGGPGGLGHALHGQEDARAQGYQLPKDTVFPAWLRDYNQVSSHAHTAVTITSKHAIGVKDPNMLPYLSKLQQSYEICGILGTLHAYLVQVVLWCAFDLTLSFVSSSTLGGLTARF